MATFEDLLDHLERPGVDERLEEDIIRLAPELSCDDAFRLQLASKQRRVAEGDRIVGYVASLTSPGARETLPDMPAPMVGALLRSCVRPETAEVELSGPLNFIEAEIGVLLKHDLEGRHLTAMEVLAAVEGYLPALEVAPIRPGFLENRWSSQHLIALQKAPGGYVLFGSVLTPPNGFDLRLEGAVISIDGEVKGSACGVEAMGDPLAVVAAVAHRLATAGERLRAGQVVMTGSLPRPQIIRPANCSARVEFTRLGSLSLRVARPAKPAPSPPSASPAYQSYDGS